MFKINQSCHQMAVVAVDDLASAFVVDFVVVAVVVPCPFVGA